MFNRRIIIIIKPRVQWGVAVKVPSFLLENQGTGSRDLGVSGCLNASALQHCPQDLITLGTWIRLIRVSLSPNYHALFVLLPLTSLHLSR